MNKVIRAGVRTKVLMLSATPVNNRFIDLKNQLALAYEGDSAQINEKLDTSTTIDVKLPNGFYISTPVGRYNPDWAIAFYAGMVKHIYFVAETKGSMRSMQLRDIEKAKIHCAKEHFKAISNGDVVYDVIDGYQALLNKVMR